MEAQKWFDQRSQDLSDQEQKFISESRTLRERLAQEEKDRQEREIEATRKLAEAQKQRAELSEQREKDQKEAARKLRRRAIAAAGAAAAAVILFVISTVMWRAANVQRALAEEQALRARAAADAAQQALTNSFFRTIGVSGQGVPPRDEREALWELAQLDRANAAVRDKLLKQWFGTAEAFMRGEARNGQGFRAVTRLNLEYHQLAISDAAELRQRLAAALENPQETDYYRLSSLSSALAALAAKMEPQAVAEIAKGFATALENPQETDSNRLSSLGSALAALAAKMELQAAAEIAKGFAAALENPQETDSNRLSTLGGALVVLAAKMEPQAAAEIAKGLGESAGNGI